MFGSSEQKGNKTLNISPLISCGENISKEQYAGLQSWNTIPFPLSSNLLVEDDEHDVNEGKEERHPENGQ